MEPRRPNANQSASDDLLAGYALGILTPEEQATLDARLATDPALREELAVLAFAVDALPLSLEPQEPSPALRDRLEAAVLADLAASQPRPDPAPRAQPASRPTVVAPPPAPVSAPVPLPPRQTFPAHMNVWAIAAAVLLVVSVAAVAWGLQQSRQAGQPTRTIAFQMTDAAAGATGEVAYMAEPGVMMLSVDNLPPLPPDQVYEVWLIPHGGEPIAAGVFAESSARHAMAGSLDDYQAVAITMEPGPLGTMAPTTAPLAVAAMEPE